MRIQDSSEDMQKTASEGYRVYGMWRKPSTKATPSHGDASGKTPEGHVSREHQKPTGCHGEAQGRRWDRAGQACSLHISCLLLVLGLIIFRREIRLEF